MIAIIDYGMGNLRSVAKGFAKVGFEATITSDPAKLLAAEKVILPGVGAFGDAMHELRERNLIDPIKECIQSGKPFLGICLGLQLLFDKGFEDGAHEGLGVFPGSVVKFQLPAEYKVPHMGWNELLIRNRPPLLNGIDEKTYVYFVHSYYVVPTNDEIIATETEYHVPFTSMIWQNNVFATQFHPEKSQAEGLKILSNFAQLQPELVST